MDLITSTRALQALRDQSEDEIIKPKRTAGVQYHIQTTQRFGNGAYTEFINNDGLQLSWRVQVLLRDLRGLTLLAVPARMVNWDQQITLTFLKEE